MKGVIFNELEDFITAGWGAAKYEEIMSRCPIHTKEPFIGPGTYPDADLFAIVAKTCEMLGVSVPDALHAFGKFVFPRLVARVPKFLDGHTHPRTLLKTVDTVHATEVRKLFKGAITPLISCDESGDTFVVRYRSARKVCPLFTGVLAAAGEHFGVPVTWKETACMHDGAEACSFDLTFEEAGKRNAA